MAVDQEAYDAALASVGLPEELNVGVEVQPRRMNPTFRATPDGVVRVLVPATFAPAAVEALVRLNADAIVHLAQRARTLAERCLVKKLVDGEEFSLVGETYRLRFIKPQSQAQVIEDELCVPRGTPEQVRRSIAKLYSAVGLAWAKENGARFEDSGLIKPGLVYEVTTRGKSSWAGYVRPPHHRLRFHWTAFGLPLEFLKHVLVHEMAHATNPPGKPHGTAWRQQCRVWMPEWRKPWGRAAAPESPVWLGDYASAFVKVTP